MYHFSHAVPTTGRGWGDVATPLGTVRFPAEKGRMVDVYLSSERPSRTLGPGVHLSGVHGLSVVVSMCFSPAWWRRYGDGYADGTTSSPSPFTTTISDTAPSSNPSLL